MSYSLFKPQTVYVEKEIINHPNTKKFLANLSFIQPTIVDEIPQIKRSSKSKNLILAKQRGDFFKRCPGTHNYICCGYKILNLVNNCDIDCTYCILQGYFDNANLFIFVNIEDLFRELDELLNMYPHLTFRIGTGELADSLSTDHITGYSKLLVSYFADKKNAIIELKTKSTQIENILDLNHNGRTVVSWSLNTLSIAKSEESKAPSLEQRLIAAKRCQDAGYKIGFHFDPMIYYQHWERDYKYVVDKIFDYIDPKQIIWISLGALRYPPQLENIIRERHQQSNIVYGELFPGLDGKYRYFKPLRIQMFNSMYQWFKDYDKDIFLYLCMESSEVWQKSFGWTPKNSASLSKLMDNLIHVDS
jgi:spore photoproduct lyase